jgi:hypothetical protein
LTSIAEAEREGSLGDVEGLRVSLAATDDKLTQTPKIAPPLNSEHPVPKTFLASDENRTTAAVPAKRIRGSRRTSATPVMSTIEFQLQQATLTRVVDYLNRTSSAENP